MGTDKPTDLSSPNERQRTYSWSMLRGAFFFAALAAFVIATILYFQLSVTFRPGSYTVAAFGLVVLTLSLFATNSVLEIIGHIIQASVIGYGSHALSGGVEAAAQPRVGADAPTAGVVARCCV